MNHQLDFIAEVSSAKAIKPFWSVTGRRKGMHAVFVVRAHTQADAIALVARHSLDNVTAQEVRP